MSENRSEGWKKLKRTIKKTRGVKLIKSLTNNKNNGMRQKNFLAFTPSMLVNQLQAQALMKSHGGGQIKAETVKQFGIVFFADLSGFTKLTEKLAIHPHGAELLCAELDKVYTLILSEVDRWGGDCIKFAGDAILFCWPIQANKRSPEFRQQYAEAAAKAVKCSLLVHKSIKLHPEVAGVKLTLHAGMGCGELTACLLGGRGKPSRWEFVIAGEPMSQIARAEPAAKPGETVISPSVAELVGGIIEADEIQSDSEKEDLAAGYWRLRGMRPIGRVAEDLQLLSQTPPPSHSLSSQTLQTLTDKQLTALSQFIPRRITKVLNDKNCVADLLPTPKSSKEPSSFTEQPKLIIEKQHPSKSRSEMREVTTLFVSVLGVDLSGPIDASQDVFRCIQDAVYTYGGSINKLLVDDKGTLVLIVFGLPPLVHQDSPARAIAAAFLMLKLLKRLDEKRDRLRAQSGQHVDSRLAHVNAHIGITTARTFCGVVGSENRREFTVMGDSVNLAARLMAACSQTEVEVTEEQEQTVVSINKQVDDKTSKEVWRPLVLVDFATVEATSHSIEHTALSPIMVKGKSMLIPLFHPTSFVTEDIRISRQLDPIESEFIGAGAKMNRTLLEKSLGRLSHKANSNAIVIVGDQGNGKHKLSQWLTQLCPKHNMKVASATLTHNMFEDGEMNLTTEFTAFRGPVLSMLQTLLQADLLPDNIVDDVDQNSSDLHKINIFKAAKELLPLPLHEDILLLELMYPEQINQRLAYLNMGNQEASLGKDTQPFKNHVKERLNAIRKKLKDPKFRVTIDGMPTEPNKGTRPLSLLGHGVAEQQWADAGLKRAYASFIQYLDTQVLKLFDDFPDQVSFGKVSSNRATPNHYQIWGANALNWNVGDGNKIKGDGQAPSFSKQTEGVYGIVTTPKHGTPSISDDLGLNTMKPSKRRQSVIQVTKGVQANYMTKLTRLLVTLITKACERLQNFDNTSHKTTHESESDNFRFLLVIDHVHALMDPSSWNLVDALIHRPSTSSNATADDTSLLLSRHSSANLLANLYSSEYKPLLCFVTRPLQGTAATAEYLEVFNQAEQNETMIKVEPLSKSDSDIFLCYCFSKHLWEHKSFNKSFRITKNEKKVLSSLSAMFGDDGVQLNEFNNFLDLFEVDDELSKFVWEYSIGCPADIIGLCDNMFLEQFITFDFTSSNKVRVSVTASKTLTDMPLSQSLRLRAIGKFQVALDDKPPSWTHVLRIASSFHGKFSLNMLSRLLEDMDAEHTKAFGSRYSATFLGDMLQWLSNDLDVLELIRDVPTWMTSESVHSTPPMECFQFRSKLLAHALRETLLHAQLELIAQSSLRFDSDVAGNCFSPRVQVLVNKPNPQSVEDKPIGLDSRASTNSDKATVRESHKRPILMRSTSRLKNSKDSQIKDDLPYTPTLLSASPNGEDAVFQLMENHPHFSPISSGESTVKSSFPPSLPIPSFSEGSLLHRASEVMFSSKKSSSSSNVKAKRSSTSTITSSHRHVSPVRSTNPLRESSPTLSRRSIAHTTTRKSSPTLRTSLRKSKPFFVPNTNDSSQSLKGVSEAEKNTRESGQVKPHPPSESHRSPQRSSGYGHVSVTHPHPPSNAPPSHIRRQSPPPPKHTHHAIVPPRPPPK